MEEELEARPGPEPEEELQVRAIRLYLKLGSMAAVGRELGVPLTELHRLSKTVWWQEEMQLIRRAEAAALDAGLTELLGTTLDELKRVLRDGETVFDKNGVAHSKPVSATSLCRIAELVFDKRQIVRGLPTAITEGGKLSELAEKLEALGKAQAAKTIEMEAQPFVEGGEPKQVGKGGEPNA